MGRLVTEDECRNNYIIEIADLGWWGVMAKGRENAETVGGWRRCSPGNKVVSRRLRLGWLPRRFWEMRDMLRIFPAQLLPVRGSWYCGGEVLQNSGCGDRWLLYFS
jgi:hypothetical protein